MSVASNPRPLSLVLPIPQSHEQSVYDTNNSVPPPRYSSLQGALPATISLDTVSNLIGNTEINLDGIAPPLRPPRYSSVFHIRSRSREQRTRTRRAARDSNHEQDRTASSSSGPQAFEYHIKGGTKSIPWATLKVYSRTSATSTSGSQVQRVPRFTTDDLVQGSLELNLDSPQTINSINLSLRGRILTSSYEDGSFAFLEHTIVSWNRNGGDPRSIPSTVQNDSGTTPRSPSPKKFEGKLSGEYNWPFTFLFPSSVTIPGQGTNLQVPQTFLERGVKGNVQYEFILRITHGMLRSDSKLQADISYIPDITPPPSSILRQLSYGGNLAIPGPEVDPVGWFTIPPATMRGKIFGERNVKFQCTVSLANPKSYTRGTFIPCHISVYSSDTEALEQIAIPKNIAIHLVRHVQYYQDAGQITGSNKSKSGSNTPSSSSAGNSTGNPILPAPIEHHTELDRAVWWTSQDVTETTLAAEATCKQFSGEIHLDKDLQPSCAFPLFKVSYAVELLPFRSSLFQASKVRSTTNEDSKTNSKRGHSITNDIRGEFDVYSRPLLSHPITITTLHGEGPIPIPFTKPKPRKERRHRKTHERDYSYSGSGHITTFL